MTAAAPVASDRRPHVVVLGAGFGGIQAAKALAGKRVRVTLVDRQNYHGFQPLYYQVATAGLEPGSVARSVRALFRRALNVEFRLGAVAGVDVAARRVALADGGPDLTYDALVVATGAETAYYGVEGAEAYGFPLKHLTDGTRLRNHALDRFERVARLGPEGAGPGALTFVVVGGGATGVEMAGAFTELFRVALPKDFKTFRTEAARVVLVERTDALLAGYPARLRAYARRVLERRGVEVRTGTAVARVEPDAVVFEGGERIATQTLVWGAGVAPGPVAGWLGAARGRGGRVRVRPDLSLPDAPEVFVVGDLAEVEGQEALPQLAQVAMQGGRRAAANALARLEGRPAAPFRYREFGWMATIGRNAAVAMLFGKIPLRGFPAWLAWVFVHLMQLVGFRNRLLVFVSWVYGYVTYDRAARLILDSDPGRPAPPPGRASAEDAANRPAAPAAVG